MRKDRLIMASLGMTTATIVASIVMTVAWYTSGNILGVNPIEITFHADKTVLGGFDPEDVENFTDTIVFNDEVDDKEYYPVSSMFSNEWMSSYEDKPVFRTGYTSVTHSDIMSYTKSMTASEENGYFSKEIYLYCESNVIITLDGEGTSFYPDSNANEETANALSEDEEERAIIKNDLDNIVKSLRMSVLLPLENEESNPDEYAYYIIDPYKEEDTYLCGNLNIHPDKSDYYHTYYQDGKEYETFFGEYNDESLLKYDAPSGADSELEGRVSEFNAKHKGSAYTVNLEKSIENGFIPVKEKSLSLKEADMTLPEGKNSGMQIMLHGYEPKKIVLSLYIEGWDKDNTSYTQMGQFYADIKFQIGEEYF